MKHRLGLIILGLLALIFTSCGTHMNTYPNSDKYLVGNQTYEGEMVNLDIDWISGKIFLIEDENVVGVKVEEETTLADSKEQVHSYFDNGTLNIKFFASGHTRSSSAPFQKDLTVTYKPGLINLKIHLTSGELNATSINATNFDLDMTSGNAVIDNLVSEKANIDLTSGSVEFKSVSSKEFDVDLTSGTCLVKFVSIERASFDLTSGTVNMELPLEGGIVKVNKTSGTVSARRECTINDNTYTFGSGSADIKVSMTSGKLIIN